MGLTCLSAALQVTTLARAYAFLLECKQMTWQQLQEAALRPYPCEQAS